MSGAAYLATAIRELRRLQRLADRAIAQVDDDGFFHAPSPEENSIALLVKHLAGNLRSRWTDFLTTDGEKPDRRRDGEFVIEPGDTRESLLERWEAGWRLAADVIEGLEPGDLERRVRIRDEPHTVLQAIERQLLHCAYHVGQIVQLARAHAGGSWRTLSIARGDSESNARGSYLTR